MSAQLMQVVELTDDDINNMLDKLNNRIDHLKETLRPLRVGHLNMEKRIRAAMDEFKELERQALQTLHEIEIH